MDYRSLHMKTVVDLRQIAKSMGVKIPAKTNKSQMVELILERQAADAMAAKAAGKVKPAAEVKPVEEAKPAVEAKPGAEEKPVVEAKLGAEEKPAAEAKPVVEAKSGVEAKPAAEAKAESTAPADDEKKRAEKPRRAAKGDGERTPAKRGRAAKADGSGKEAAQAEPQAQAAPAVEAASAQAASTMKDAQAARPAEAPAAEVLESKQEVWEEVPEYHRPMSTQQRMGARAQPMQGAYRANQRPMGQAAGRANRFDGTNQRPQRSFESNQGGFRRSSGGEGAQHGYRRQDDGSQGYRRPQGKAEDGVQNFHRPANPSEEGSQGYRRPQANAADGSQSVRRPAGGDAQEGAYRRFVPAVNPDAQAANPRAARPEESARASVRPETAAEGALPATAAEGAVNPAVPDMLSSGECGDGAGILEIHAEGYGFLRAENYLPGNRDVYVSAAQIRRFNLRTGDYVVGKTRAQQMGDRSVGLIYISEVNGQTPDMARRRRPFDSLVPVYPDERLRLERPEKNDISLRLIDMIAPIGKGQRGMIVSQPKAGKTTLLKKIANAITTNNPDVHLIVLLIDERPEEVTDMRRSIQGEVVYSTFDEAPENHTRVSEMVLERAQRLVELGTDVVVLLDSITRLARAYNLVIPPTGRSLSGGLDPGALFKPKRFFGAARNIENGGSLTIIATALVDTGSRMDDIIFEEFKGTGNMELHLDRSLSDRRIFPAIDLYRSGTRREELLLDKEELEGVYQVRRMLSKGSPQEAAEQLISLMDKTKTNQEFFQKLKGWLNVCEKDGFTMR